MSARLLALTPGTLRLKRLKDRRETAQQHTEAKMGEKVVYDCRVSGNEVIYPGTRQ